MPDRTASAGRDPVSIAIETLLCEMHANGFGSFRKTSSEDSVKVSFGEMRAEGTTLDIALVRLASAMMEDVRYARFLMEALDEPMRAIG